MIDNASHPDLAGFELFRRPPRQGRKPAPGLWLTLAASGAGRLNAAAHTALGAPSAIALYWYAEGRIIALRASADTARDTPVTTSAAGGVRFAAKRFCTAQGIERGRTQRLALTIREGTAFSTPVQTVAAAAGTA